MELNQVVTRAAYLPKKVNKQRAHELLVDLIKHDEIPVAEAAELYSFFLPTLPAKPKTPEQWVAKALARKRDPRHYLHHLYADGFQRLVATDGHRIHIYKIDMAPGYYDRALNPVDCTTRYPDIDRVIPQWGEMHIAKRALPVEIINTITAYRLPTGGAVNKTYWDEATAGLDEVWYTVNDRGVYRISFQDGRDAVVMGLTER